MKAKTFLTRSFSQPLKISVLVTASTAWIAIATPGANAQIDRYFTIQPIQVCNDAGLNCSPTPFFADETAKIYQQAGVQPVFLPATQLLNSSLLALIDGDSDNAFIDNIDVAGNGQSANPTTINMWFVSDLVDDPGWVTYGEAWINANGLVIDGNAVQNFNSGNGRRDTIAHELGHNFGLGHSNFGAGGADNLMTAGSSRSIPDGVGNIIPDGADLSQLTAAQIAQIRSSALLNQVPEVLVDTNGSTPYDTNDFFLVDFHDGPLGTFLQSMTLDLSPVNAFFDSLSSGPFYTFPGGDGSPFQLSNLSGLNASDITLVGGNNALDGTQQMTLNFAPNAFVSGDSFRFGIDIDLLSNIDNFGATPEELIGSLFSFTFSDGYSLQTDLDGDLIASSLNPTKILPFVGQPTGGVKIPPGRITDTHDPEPVPEPSSTATLLLLGLGSLGLSWKKERAVTPNMRSVKG